MKKFDSLFDLMDAFPDEQSCIDHLRAIHWSKGEFCPLCGCTKIYCFADKKTFKCGECRQRFSIKVGTIFQDTKLPLCKWFMAIWLITSHPKGVASTTLAKDLNITQKSAWFVLHRLRHAARTQSFAAPLDGMVEADTTFVGGKEKNKHAGKKMPGSQGDADKVAVMGVIKRDSELRTEHVENAKAKTLQGVVCENVANGAVMMTDVNRSSVGLDKDYLQLTVNYPQGEYVRLGRFVHVSNIEALWALLKRQIFGIDHWVSDQHLRRYLAEMAWRYNLHQAKVNDRINALFACVESPTLCKVLIA